MVTTILFICAFLLAGLYMIAGSVASYKLSNHLGYSGGFLKLWNTTQLSVMSFGKLDYSLDDTEASQLFAKLKKIILFFYSVFIPLVVITFVMHFLGM